MATNLRLRPDAEEAVRREAHRTGSSQQDVIRDAVDAHLGLTAARGAGDETSALVAAGVVRAPRRRYRRLEERLVLPAGTTSADLLDRSDRL